MGTNVYMRKIPTAKEKDELKELLKKQYMQVIESIDRGDGLYPGSEDWELSNDIEKMRKMVFEEVHIGKRSYGWKFLFAPNPQYYEENKESVLRFLHQEGWLLLNEYGNRIDPDAFWDEYVSCHKDGLTGAEYDRQEREKGRYNMFPAAGFEHITPEGLRFARDSDFS